MKEGLKPYSSYCSSEVPWVATLPAHWAVQRGKRLFGEAKLPVGEDDEIVTCFRDGQVTLRSNRRTSGFMIALKEMGYQGVRKGQLVIHAMDAFAGAIGISDSDGKCTPEYIVCIPRDPTTLPAYFARALRLAAHSDFIQVSCSAVRERAPRLRYPNFGEMLLPVPPAEEQAAIVRYLDHADRRIRRYIHAKQKLIKLLKEQERTVIHHLMTRGLVPGVPMKESGVECLGEVPEHWDVLTLGRVGTFIRGRGGPKSEDCVYGIPRVRYGELYTSFPYRIRRTLGFVSEGTASRYLPIRRGDVLFTLSGETIEDIGASAEVDIDGAVCGGDIAVLRATGGFAPGFLGYLSRAPAVVLQKSLCATGTTVKHISSSALANIRVAIPPPAEQGTLVRHLDELVGATDVIVADTQKEITLLRELRTRLIADVVTGQLDVRAAAAALPDEVGEDEHMDDEDGDGEGDDLDMEDGSDPGDDDD